jgi:hypothetical protein
MPIPSWNACDVELRGTADDFGTARPRDRRGDCIDVVLTTRRAAFNQFPITHTIKTFLLIHQLI